MKRKLFTLLTLLCFAVSGVLADDVVSTLTAKNEAGGMKIGDTYMKAVAISSGISWSSNKMKLSSNTTSSFDVEIKDAYASSYTISQILITYDGSGRPSAFSGNDIAVSSNTTWSAGSTTPTKVSFSITSSGSEVKISQLEITLTPVPTTSYTVTFNAGTYGTCATASLTEDSPGAGVTLPDVTDNSEYIFKGWYTASSGGTKEGVAGDTYKPKADITLYAQYTTTAITYNLNVGTSGTTIKSSTATNNNTKITAIDIDQEHAGANGDGVSDRTTKLAIKVGANGADWAADPENFVLFKFTVADGYQFTLDDASIKIANVGSKSADNIKYKAVLSDANNSIETTYVCTTQDGTVETFLLENAGRKSFTGNVTLKLWAWTIVSKDNGGSAFRMGTPLTITGVVRQEATVTLAPACTDGAEYFGTYSNSKAFVVPADLTVSAIKLNASKKMELMKYSTGDIVAPNTGVLVSSNTSGDHTVLLTVDEGTTKDGNLLLPSGDTGVTASSMADTDYYYYRLTMNGTNNPGFWWKSADGAGFDLGANKAYLKVLKSAAVEAQGFWFDDETTGIANVNRKQQFSGEYYNLNGQKVAQPTKGLYIVNGKKVVIK